MAADRRRSWSTARPEGLLLVAQSNAGLPQVVGDHFEYDATPADMAEHAPRPARRSAST